MADRIDAERSRMQTTHRKPMIHSVFPNPQCNQLPPRNHPVLSARQLGDARIGRSAKPPQPAYIAG